MFSQIQNEVVMDWAMGMEWWKSKDSADDVVVFKEDLILPHEYWVGRDGMVRPPQEHLPTLPQTPAHSGHCLLTRQSLHRKGENGMICHPSADLGQTGRKSGLLPLLSSLTIILSTSNPSALVIIIKWRDPSLSDVQFVTGNISIKMYKDTNTARKKRNVKKSIHHLPAKNIAGRHHWLWSAGSVWIMSGIMKSCYWMCVKLMMTTIMIEAQQG